MNEHSQGRGMGGILVLGVTFIMEHHQRRSASSWKVCGEPRPDPRYSGSQETLHSSTFPGYISKKGLNTVSSEKYLKPPYEKRRCLALHHIIKECLWTLVHYLKTVTV